MCVCGRVLGFCISPVLVLKHSDTTEKNETQQLLEKAKQKQQMNQQMLLVWEKSDVCLCEFKWIWLFSFT